MIERFRRYLRALEDLQDSATRRDEDFRVFVVTFITWFFLTVVATALLSHLWALAKGCIWLAKRLRPGSDELVEPPSPSS